MIITNDTKSLFPDQTFPAAEVVPDSLIQVVTTVAGGIEGDVPAMRVPFIREDPTSTFVPEGAEIPLDDVTADEILILTSKISLISKMSREAAEYNTAANLVATSMSRSVTTKANAALLANPETAGEPTGLLNVAGIMDGGTLGKNLDVVSNAITLIEANGGTATHIVTDPVSWGVLRNLKSKADSNIPLIGAPGEQVERRLFSLPVLTTPQMPVGTMLVLDNREIISVVGDIKLSTSDQQFFTSDSIARRVTWRIGWGVVRPDRIAKITVTTD